MEVYGPFIKVKHRSVTQLLTLGIGWVRGRPNWWTSRPRLKRGLVFPGICMQETHLLYLCAPSVRENTRPRVRVRIERVQWRNLDGEVSRAKVLPLRC